MDQSPEDKAKIEAIKKRALQERIKRKLGEKNFGSDDNEPLSMEDILNPKVSSSSSKKSQANSERSDRPKRPRPPERPRPEPQPVAAETSKVETRIIPTGSGMSWGVKLPLLVIGAFLVAVLARYGTVSPCGMLEHDLRAQLAKQMMGKVGSGSTWETLGGAVGISVGGNMIENMVASLNPMQCTRALWRVHVTGQKPLSEMVGSSDTSPLATRSSSGTNRKSPEERKKELEAMLYPKGWGKDIDTSPMDDSKIVHLSTWADKSIQDWLDNEHRPSLYLRCKENKTEAFINLGTDPEYDYGDYGAKTARLRLRYDSEPAKTETLGLSTSGEAVFFRSAIPTIKKMLTHEKLLVEVRLNRTGGQLFTFTLAGLDAVVPELRQACKRQRAGQQQAHGTHLAIVDQAQRPLHAVEQLNHCAQSRNYVDLVADVGLVRRDDREPERRAEADGEHQQPHQRTHQRRQEAASLMNEAQGLALDNGTQGD